MSAAREPIGSSIAGTLLRQVLAALVQLGSVVLVARLLGVQGNGMYASAMLLPGLLAILLAFGLPAAAVYYLTAVRCGRGAVLDAMQVVGGRLVAAGLVGGALFILWFGPRLFPDVPRSLLVLALLYFPASLVPTLLMGVLQAEGRFRTYNRLALAGPVLTLMLLGGATLLGVRSPGVVIALVTASQWCVAVAVWWTVGPKRIGPAEFAPGVPNGAELRHGLLRYGLRAHAANVVAYMNYRADMYFIAAMAGNAAMGLYAVAVQFSERLFIVSQAASTVLLPLLAGMQDEPARRRDMAAFAARWSFLATLATGAGLYVVLAVLVGEVFGPAYSGMQPALAILFAGAAVTGVSRILANAVAAQGRPEYNAVAGLLGAVVNIILCIVLVPTQGIVGAALASLAGFVVQGAVILGAWCRLNATGPAALLRVDGDRDLWRELYVRARSGR